MFVPSFRVSHLAHLVFYHTSLPLDRLDKVESLLDDADLSIDLSREKFESLNDELFTR